MDADPILPNIRFRTLRGWSGPDTPDRKPGPFRSSYDRTLSILRYELRRIAAAEADILIATDSIRVDGQPYAEARVSHPGVVLNATTERGLLSYATDACTKWIDNLHAIALTLERLRLCGLYGVLRGQQYKGSLLLTAGSGGTQFASADDALRFIISTADGQPEGAAHDGQASALRKNKKLFAFTLNEALRQSHPDTNPRAPPGQFEKVREAQALCQTFLFQDRKGNEMDHLRNQRAAVPPHDAGDGLRSWEEVRDRWNKMSGQKISRARVWQIGQRALRKLIAQLRANSSPPNSGAPL